MSIFKKIKIILAIFVSVVIVNNVSADNTVGLMLNDTTQSFDGYTLFAPNLAKVTYLIDNNGNLVHQWVSDFIPGMSAYLLENGNLLRSGAVSDPTGTSQRTGGFELFDWDNNLIWSFYQGTQHHDIEPMPNGNVLLVTNDRKSNNLAIQAGRDPNFISGTNVRSLSIVEVEQNSEEIVWQWNAWDHLIQDFDTTKDNYGVVVDHPELMNINYAKDGSQDWLHTNSVAYNTELDQIIVSNRNTNEIWVIDHSTTIEETATHSGGKSGKGGDILYRWGNPIAYGVGTEADKKLFEQHDARWIASELEGEGNIMVFNNGNGRPEGAYSTVIEIVPPIDVNGNYTLDSDSSYEPASPLWEYSSDTPTDFSSPRYGGSQRLPNGKYINL